MSEVTGKDSFGITGPRKVMTGDSLSLKCSASIYKYEEDSIEWYKDTLSRVKLLLLYLCNASTISH